MQRHVPGYTTALQNASKETRQVKAASRPSSGRAENAASTCEEGAQRRKTLRPAPEITGINAWLNTDGDKPLTSALHGKVVGSTSGPTAASTVSEHCRHVEAC